MAFVAKELVGLDGGGEGTVFEETWTYRVQMSNVDATPWEVMTGASFPAYLSTHGDNPLMTRRGLTAKRDAKTKWYWIATVKWSSAQLSQQERDLAIEDPLDRPPVINWSSRDEIEAMFADIDGLATINSAGDYYDPPLERIVGCWTVTVEANVATVPAAILDYGNAVNDAAFTIDGITIPQGAARIAAIGIPSEMEENGVEFRRFSYTLELRRPHPVDYTQVRDPADGTPVDPEPWDDVILDQGLRELIPSDGGITQINDDNGNQINSPVPLDGEGVRLVAPTPSTVIYFRHRKHYRESFAGLPGVT